MLLIFFYWKIVKIGSGSIKGESKLKVQRVDRVKCVGADCVLDAGNQIPAPRYYQDCPTELEFVD